MTWTPPPDRPHGYECLALVEIYESVSIWVEVVWQSDYVDEPYWFIPILDCDHEQPARFAPLPDEAAARIAELEAEVADQKRMRQEEKAKILRQRAEIVSLLNENGRHLSMARGLQKRVAALETAEADNARRRREVSLIAESLEAWAQCARDGRPIDPSVVGLTDMARTLRAIAADSVQKRDTP